MGCLWWAEPPEQPLWRLELQATANLQASQSRGGVVLSVSCREHLEVTISLGKGARGPQVPKGVGLLLYLSFTCHREGAAYYCIFIFLSFLFLFLATP